MFQNCHRLRLVPPPPSIVQQNYVKLVLPKEKYLSGRGRLHTYTRCEFSSGTTDKHSGSGGPDDKSSRFHFQIIMEHREGKKYHINMNMTLQDYCLSSYLIFQRGMVLVRLLFSQKGGLIPVHIFAHHKSQLNS